MRNKIETIINYIDWTHYVNYLNKNYWNNILKDKAKERLIYSLYDNETIIIDKWIEYPTLTLNEVLQELDIISIGGNWLFHSITDYLIYIQKVEPQDVLFFKFKRDGQDVVMNIKGLKNDEIKRFLNNYNEKNIYYYTLHLELLNRNEYQESDIFLETITNMLNDT